MGFSDEYLRSDKWMMKYSKKDMLKKIHDQRCVIRKLIEKLDQPKKEVYLKVLQDLEEE